MALARLRIIALLMCSLVGISSKLQADSTPPPDPIIDTELGSGSYAFFGQVQLQINWGDLTPSANCHAVGTSGDFTVDDCTGANGGFITQAHVIVNGVDTGLQADTLLNESGATITNLDFLLSQSQGPFSPTSPFSAPSTAVFNQVTNLSSVEAIYSLNPQFAPGICSTAIIQITAPTTCPNEVSIGLEHILIDENGSLGITLTSNVPLPSPEPSEAVLLLSTLPVVWIGAKRVRRQSA
jgi:hypothetical protein